MRELLSFCRLGFLQNFAYKHKNGATRRQLHQLFVRSYLLEESVNPFQHIRCIYTGGIAYARAVGISHIGVDS